MSSPLFYFMSSSSSPSTILLLEVVSLKSCKIWALACCAYLTFSALFLASICSFIFAISFAFSYSRFSFSEVIWEGTSGTTSCLTSSFFTGGVVSSFISTSSTGLFSSFSTGLFSYSYTKEAGFASSPFSDRLTERTGLSPGYAGGTGS